MPNMNVDVDANKIIQYLCMKIADREREIAVLTVLLEEATTEDKD